MPAMTAARAKEGQGEQIEDLVRALISAFPGEIDLARVVSRLGVQLRDVAPGDTASELAFSLVRWAIGFGRLEDLVRFACEHAPDNLLLQRYVGKYGGAPRSEEQRFRALDDLLTLYRAQYAFRVVEGLDVTALVRDINWIRQQMRHGLKLHEGEVLGPIPGRYRLREVIGEGGFATVFMAVDTKTPRNVAIKVLHSNMEATHLERFQRGALRMQSLQDNPYVAKVLEAEGEHLGFHYFVMEHYPLGDLDKAVRKRALAAPEHMSFDVEDGLRVVLNAGEALQYAHAQKLIHRDVKPKNILIGSDGKARLSDFDLVRVPDPVSRTLTEAGMGEYLYSAPEQYEGRGSDDCRADVYSLGMTAIFVLSGSDPPRGAWRLSPSFDGFHCPETLKPILARAIAYDPAARYDSVASFCHDLDAALARLAPGELDHPTDPILLLRVLGSISAPAPADIERLLGLLDIPMRHIRCDAAAWIQTAMDILRFAEAYSRMNNVAAAIEQVWPGTFNRFFRGAATSPVRREPIETETPPARGLLLDMLCRLTDVELELVMFHLKSRLPGLPWMLHRGPLCDQIDDILRELYDKHQLGLHRLVEAIELWAGDIGVEQPCVPRSWQEAAKLHFCLRSATRRLAEAFPGDGPVEIQQLSELVRDRRFATLQAESNSIWLGIRRFHAASQSKVPDGIHEIYDEIERLTRRLGEFEVDHEIPDRPRDERQMALLDALNDLPEHLFTWVLLYCAIPGWVLPPSSNARAARVVTVLRSCEQWLPIFDVVEAALRRCPTEMPKQDEPADHEPRTTVPSSISSVPAGGSPREVLLDELANLPPARLDTILLEMGVRLAVIAPHAATRSDRAVDVLRYCESAFPDGLDALSAAVHASAQGKAAPH